MKELRSFLITVFGMGVGIITSILVLMKGRGLEPQSWWWIIGVYLLGHTMAQLILLAGRSKKE